MKRFSIFLSLILVVSLVSVFAADNLVPDEIIVKFDKSVTDVKKNDIKSRHGLTKKADSYKIGEYVIFKHKNPKAILAQLKKETGVVFVEQNAIAHKTMVPNDTYYAGYQWNMTRIGMENAWDLSTGYGVVVAVVDTGVDQALPDLAGTNFMAGYDFVNSDNDPTDDDGHGSHVSGTIAQTTNNNLGCAGIAYNATIMPVKVLNSQGSGTYTQISDGIYYAADNGADVINLSLGGSSNLSILENAINYAWNNGVVVICAAGNDGVSTPFYPAAYTNSVSVSATNYIDALAAYSNYGSTIDISAPGGDDIDHNGNGYIDGILQNTMDGYYFFYGTSMASPHVAAVAALVKAANGSLTNAQIRNILETTAEDMGASGWDQYFGYGLVDAYAAVQAAGGGGNLAPNASFTFTTTLLTAYFTDTSTDPDGTIVDWDWDFGDTGTSSAQNPSHTYAANGTYTVTLTVTDNEGATDSFSDDVTVSDGTAPEIFVDNIAISVQRRGRRYRANSTITIRDTNGSLVPNATVYITWSGAYSGTSSATTDSSGNVSFSTAYTRSSGPYTITVTNVTHATMNYNSSLNNETSDSASY